MGEASPLAWFADRAMTRRVTLLLVLFVAYFVSARLGLELHAINRFAALIWPPTGIAFAGLLLGGFELWPAIALGAFAVNLSIGAPVLAALGIAFGNTLEATLGAYALRAIFKLDYSFERLRDGAYLLFTALTATLVSATVGVAALWLAGEIPTGLGFTWIAWWIGDALGALVVTPFLLIWLAKPLRRQTPGMIAEATGILALLLVMCWVIFWTPYFPYVYPLAIPLAWAALRTGPRGATLAVLILAAIGATGTFLGRGAFAIADVLRGVLFLQFAVAIASSLFLMFASIMVERRRALEALRRHVGTLEETLTKTRSEDKAKTEFLAVLAHELRNPLAPIVSTFELLKMDEWRQDRVTMIESAEKQAHIMRRLLDDLLDVARVSQDRFKLQKELITLQSAIEQSIGTVKSFLKAERHTFLASVPEEPLWLYADAVRMSQVFSNILFNAAKYTKPGGRITLTALKEGRSAIVRIQDNGAGIAPDLLSKIFEPFVSVNPSAQIGTGLGIGLSLARRILSLHDGTIEAKSAGPGKGSMFTVRVPLVFPAALEVKAKKRQSARERALRILIVDDNEAAAEGLGKLLRRNGHEVCLAHTGEDALSSVNAFEPEAILLDIGLPDISGYEIAERIRRERGSGIMLIALTGYGQAEDKRKAEAAGFNHHLTKPVGIQDLRSALFRVSEKKGGVKASRR